MSCTPASRVPPSPHSMITITEPTDSDVQPVPSERRASRAYQIFPPMSEAECEERSEELGRERLPSIVVEPTEVNESMESGELRWPVSPEEEEDPFPESSPSAESPAGDKQGSETGGRKSSIGPAQPLNYNRLTPPSSPTAREALPPCKPKELSQ